MGVLINEILKWACKVNEKTIQKRKEKKKKKRKEVTGFVLEMYIQFSSVTVTGIQVSLVQVTACSCLRVKVYILW